MLTDPPHPPDADRRRLVTTTLEAFQHEVLGVVERYEPASEYVVLQGLMEIFGDRLVKARAKDPERAYSWSVKMLKAFQQLVSPTPTRPH